MGSTYDKSIVSRQLLYISSICSRAFTTSEAKLLQFSLCQLAFHKSSKILQILAESQMSQFQMLQIEKENKRWHVSVGIGMEIMLVSDKDGNISGDYSSMEIPYEIKSQSNLWFEEKATIACCHFTQNCYSFLSVFNDYGFALLSLYPHPTHHHQPSYWNVSAFWL